MRIGNLRVRIKGIDKLSVRIIGIGNLRVRSIGIDFNIIFSNKIQLELFLRRLIFLKYLKENPVSILQFVYITHRIPSNSFIILKTIFLEVNASK